MELGDSTTAERHQRSVVDEALDTFDAALTDLISTVETGGLDHLHADQQVAVWQRFERIRNKLPLVDHRLIAAADAADLPREYCSATMTQFLVRVLQLSHGEAAARVRAAAAVGPRTSMLGEHLAPLLPQLAALQRDGVVSAAKVQIVERAMHTLTRPNLDAQAVETAELLLTEQAPILAPAELHRFAHAVVAAADPDGPEPLDDQLQHDRRYLELRQRRDGMWWCGERIHDGVQLGADGVAEPALQLLCRYHHTHFLQKGWSCRINTDRLPEWIPPRWIDQDQQPHINTRIRRLHAQRRLEGNNQQRRQDAA
jgi:hypothetical protein